MCLRLDDICIYFEWHKHNLFKLKFISFICQELNGLHVNRYHQPSSYVYLDAFSNDSSMWL